MDSDIEVEAELSKFQVMSDLVLRLLERESTKPVDQKLIYNHQKEALIAVKDYFSDGVRNRPALVVAPTGAGKTGIVCLLPYVLASPKVLILSPSVKVTEQLEKGFGQRNDVAIESFVYQRGLIKDLAKLNKFLEVGKRINDTECILNMDKWNLVIVNAQKFGANSKASISEQDEDDEDIRNDIRRVKENFLNFTTLIVDEAHHFPASLWDNIVQEFQGKQIIFLTATPFRGIDRKELWSGQEITFSITKPTLIDLNIIRRLEYRNLQNIDDNRRIGMEICQILSQHDQEESAIQHKAMILVKDTDAAIKGACEMGEKATYCIADKKGDRNLKYFEDPNNNCRILFVCGRLLEGYDHHPVSVCVILRNVRVLGLFTQYVGRCIRKSNRTDTVTGVILSHPNYNQRSLYRDYINN